MTDIAFVVINSIAICILIIILIKIIFNYSYQSYRFKNLHYLITTHLNNKIIMAENDPLRIKMLHSSSVVLSEKK